MENNETKYPIFWCEIDDASSKLEKSDLLFDRFTMLKPKPDFLDLVSNAELYSRVAKARLLSRGEPKI